MSEIPGISLPALYEAMTHYQEGTRFHSISQKVALIWQMGQKWVGKNPEPFLEAMREAYGTAIERREGEPYYRLAEGSEALVILEKESNKPAKKLYGISKRREDDASVVYYGMIVKGVVPTNGNDLLLKFETEVPVDDFLKRFETVRQIPFCAKFEQAVLPTCVLMEQERLTFSLDPQVADRFLAARLLQTRGTVARQIGKDDLITLHHVRDLNAMVVMADNKAWHFGSNDRGEWRLSDAMPYVAGAEDFETSRPLRMAGRRLKKELWDAKMDCRLPEDIDAILTRRRAEDRRIGQSLGLSKTDLTGAGDSPAEQKIR